MRHFISLVLLASVASLAGCASPMVARGHDTAVRAEPRRVSASTAQDPIPATFAAPTRMSAF